VNIGTATGLEGRRARHMEEQIEQLYTDVFPGQELPRNPLAALREEITSASARAEFLGVYRGNLSALDLLTEISKLVPKKLDVVFDELSIDRQIIRMRVYAKSFESADRLGAELAKFPPFAQARIGSIESDPKRGGKRFDVTISLAPSEDSG
jgi:type II secretory pathway component PulL